MFVFLKEHQLSVNTSLWAFRFLADVVVGDILNIQRLLLILHLLRWHGYPFVTSGSVVMRILFLASLLLLMVVVNVCGLTNHRIRGLINHYHHHRQPDKRGWIDG